MENGVLAPAVVLERVQPIAREHAEIVEPGREIHVLQLRCEKLFDLAMARNG